MPKEKKPAPTLEELQQKFEEARLKIREIEDRARHRLPHGPPGDDDDGNGGAPAERTPRRLH